VGALQELGRYGEDVAVRHLHDQGLVILERNWRRRAGEIDIVARHGDVLVFCEVKTRRSDRFGSPVEAVTPRKLARMRVLAAAWLAERRPPYAADLRFDVVSVLRPPSGPARVEHLQGVC
jgi:putative endonuclease